MTEWRTETWRQVILSFESAVTYPNPFLDVTIRARFAGPDGRCIEREAYWDGGAVYRVAFAPTAEGIWDFVLEAPEETGLSGKTGTVVCTPYTGDLAIYRHGFLKVSDDHRHLSYADGTPFFWLGDTHWAFAFGEKWEESNHPEMQSMFRGMADRRKAQGFTVYQTNLRSDPIPGQTTNKYWEDGALGTLPRVSFYQEELDRRMYYLADLGLVNALGLAWFMSITDRIPLWKNMARYMIARYGALPMVWTLAGEVAGYAPEPARSHFIDSWREVALYIEANDSYGNLQTAHYDNHRPFSDYYYGEGWYDFTLNQAGHGDFPVSASDFASYRAEHPDKPFVEGESLYEFCSTLEENGTRLCTADMVRRVAYTAIQCGACGYTYGAQGIWDNVWEKPEEPQPFNVFNRFGIAWYESIEGPGAVQMGLLRNFYLEEGYSDMKPVSVGSVSPFGVTEADALPGMFSPLALKTEDGGKYIVYYNEHTRGGARIRVPEKSAWNVTWFDPRTGERTEAGSVTEAEGFVSAPGRPDGHDWVQILTVKG